MVVNPMRTKCPWNSRGVQTLANINSRANAYRTFAACGRAPGTENTGRQYLSQYATAGSRVAMDELRDVISSKELQDIDLKRFITQAGVGAMWYDTPNMLGKFSTASVLRMAPLESAAVSRSARKTNSEQARRYDTQIRRCMWSAQDLPISHARTQDGYQLTKPKWRSIFAMCDSVGPWRHRHCMSESLQRKRFYCRK